MLFHGALDRVGEHKVHIDIVAYLLDLFPRVWAQASKKRFELRCMMVKHNGDTVLLCLFRDHCLPPKTAPFGNMKVNQVDFVLPQHMTNFRERQRKVNCNTHLITRNVGWNKIDVEFVPVRV